jgi:hypothetical protein
MTKVIPAAKTVINRSLGGDDGEVLQASEAAIHKGGGDTSGLLEA